MTQPPRSSLVALLRFAIVSQVLARMLRGEPRVDAVRECAEREHIHVDGSVHRFSTRSIYRWLAAYEEGGVAALEPRSRKSSALTSVLPKKFVEFCKSEKDRDPAASVPELIRRARGRGLLSPHQKVSRSTVFRLCRRMGLPLGRLKQARNRDARRFAYPHRMDMVLCDGKHFRAGSGRHKRVALFFLDDATRLVLHTVVGTSENAALFQRGLFECICKHGFMSALYLDHGPGFIAEDTVSVMAHLKIPLVYGEVAYKEGHGKIERFNRTAKAAVLRGLDGRPDIDSSCGSLELRLQHYTEKVYAMSPHESLDQGQTPLERFQDDPKALRFPEDRDSLRRAFEIWEEREVSNDNIVSIDSGDYEMPRGYAGRKVILHRRLLERTIGFVHQGKVIDLHIVDLHANARSPRAKKTPSVPEKTQDMAPTTAAQMAFDHDYDPLVDEDGGFPGINIPDDEEIPW